MLSKWISLSALFLFSTLAHAACDPSAAISGEELASQLFQNETGPVTSKSLRHDLPILEKTSRARIIAACGIEPLGPTQQTCFDGIGIGKAWYQYQIRGNKPDYKSRILVTASGRTCKLGYASGIWECSDSSGNRQTYYESPHYCRGAGG